MNRLVRSHISLGQDLDIGGTGSRVVQRQIVSILLIPFFYDFLELFYFSF